MSREVAQYKRAESLIDPSCPLLSTSALTS